MTTSRIDMLKPPYPDSVAKSFARIMSEGVPPLNIFRTLARHEPLFDKTMALGGILLYKGLLDPADRELVILRTCARCGAEYEWGVHVVGFARKLGLSESVITATANGGEDDPAWNARQRTLIRMADELHDTATIADPTWETMATHWSDEQRMELVLVAGFYNVISFSLNAFHVPLENHGERFPEDHGAGFPART